MPHIKNRDRHASARDDLCQFLQWICLSVPSKNSVNSVNSVKSVKRSGNPYTGQAGNPYTGQAGNSYNQCLQHASSHPPVSPNQPVTGLRPLPQTGRTPQLRCGAGQSKEGVGRQQKAGFNPQQDRPSTGQGSETSGKSAGQAGLRKTISYELSKPHPPLRGPPSPEGKA
jgi:hypothetical protein